MPVAEGQGGQQGGGVVGAAAELCGGRCAGGDAAERLVVLSDLVFADNLRVGWVGDADQVHPAPRAAESGIGEGAVDLVGGKHVGSARDRYRGVSFGALLDAGVN